jgi:hypothetical protein
MARTRNYKKKTYKRAPRKRTYKKKTYKKRTTVSQLSSSPIAARQLVKLKYCQRIQLDTFNNGTSTSRDDSLTKQTFRMNSLYDPDYTNATGGIAGTIQAAGQANHQPYGFDNWCQFYNHYRVVGAKITVTCFNQGLNSYVTTGTDIDGMPGVTNTTRGNNPANSGVYFGLHIDDDNTIVQSYTHAKETNKYSFVSVLPGQKKTITRNWSLKKWKAIHGSADDIDQWGALINTDPQKTALAHVLCNNISCLGGLDIPPVDVEVSIEYICLMGELKEITQS